GQQRGEKLAVALAHATRTGAVCKTAARGYTPGGSPHAARRYRFDATRFCQLRTGISRYSLDFRPLPRSIADCHTRSTLSAVGKAAYAEDRRCPDRVPHKGLALCPTPADLRGLP